MFWLSNPPFLKIAIVNINVTISQKATSHLGVLLIALDSVVDSDIHQRALDLH